MGSIPRNRDVFFFKVARFLGQRRMEIVSVNKKTIGNKPINPRNRLIYEHSTYLLQHVTNPVNWQPWNDIALQTARTENKLIFLSIGYATCHWCHVMERESFENEEIADIMNENFVNIKVDREERPDVDKVYMNFVQLTTGSGGWPLSVFLTYDLKPVYGGTYFPPDDKWGRPGFKTVLRNISEQWKSNPSKLLALGEKLSASVQKASVFELDAVRKMTADQVPSASSAGQLCFKQFNDNYDTEYGGIGLAPKFPQPSNLAFFFHFASRDRKGEPNKLAHEMAMQTLNMMARGGIHDHIGYGFSRYSTDREWHVPHFEKMLYDQAQLAVAYSTGYLLSKEEKYRDVLVGILTYMDRDLSFRGGFYSAEDADSLPTETATEKKEGAFYVWSYDEIVSLLSIPLASKPDIMLYKLFQKHYGVRKNGNVDGSNDPHGELINQNVLIVKDGAVEKFGLSEQELKTELEKARKILFKARNKRPRPQLDVKIITAWNGLAISGFSKAAQVLQEEQYKERAIQCAEFMKKNLRNTEVSLIHCTYTDEDKKVLQNGCIPGFLNDYAFVIRGLLDLYECCYDSKWIEWGEQLQDTQNQTFWDDKQKVFNVSPLSDTILPPVMDDHDGAEPSGNSVSVQNLIRLSAYLDRSDYLERAGAILSSFTSPLTRLPSSLPEMMCSLMMFHDAPTCIYVHGSLNDPETTEMLRVIHEYHIPNRVLAVLDGKSTIFEQNETAKSILHAKSGKLPQVHICQNRSCSLPVSNTTELNTLLRTASGQ